MLIKMQCHDKYKPTTQKVEKNINHYKYQYKPANNKKLSLPYLFFYIGDHKLLFHVVFFYY